MDLLVHVTQVFTRLEAETVQMSVDHIVRDVQLMYGLAMRVLAEWIEVTLLIAIAIQDSEIRVVTFANLVIIHAKRVQEAQAISALLVLQIAIVYQVLTLMECVRV